MSGYSDFDLHQVCSGYDSLKHLCLSEETLFTSAKMERLRVLLPELVAQGHRILLFSQWTRLLDLFEVRLWRRPTATGFYCGVFLAGDVGAGLGWCCDSFAVAYVAGRCG